MRHVVLVLLGLSLSACGQTFFVVMPPATPDLIVRPRSRATFVLEGSSGVDPVCLPVGLDMHCVQGIRRELEAGARTVLGSFLTPAGASPADYVGRLGAIGVTLRSGGRGGPTSVVLDWQFTLDDAQGQHLIRLRDTTVGAVPVGYDERGLVAPLEGVENDVLERIRSAVGDSVVAHPPTPGS
jgi:hypothetical protein